MRVGLLLSSMIALALGVAPPVRGDAIVVDPAASSGNGHLALVAALDNAVDGDVLLLRAGNYTISPANHVVVKKGVTLINDSGAPLILCSVRVENTTASQRVNIRGLTIVTTVLTTIPIRVSNCAGPVWVEDCILRGTPGIISGITTIEPNVALYSNGPGGITIVRSTLVGGPSGYDAAANTTTYGGTALWVSGAPVHLSHSKLIAGSPSQAPGAFVPGTSNSPGFGIFALDSTLFVADCQVQGGSPMTSGLGGGHALQGTGSTVTYARSSTFLGGGSAPPFSPSTPPPTQFAAPVGSFEISAPVRTGQLATIDIAGQPGDLCGFFVGVPNRPLVSIAAQGALLLDAPSMIGPIVIGNVGPSGTLSVSFPTASLPAGSTGLGLAIQGVILSPFGTLESGSVYVQVDAGL